MLFCARRYTVLGLLGSALIALMALMSSALANDTVTVINGPGSGTNRIEVTGNSENQSQSGCGAGSTTVNSVNVDGKALQGKTLIIAGRNSRSTRTDEACAEDRRHIGNRDGTSVNSINIR